MTPQEAVELARLFQFDHGCEFCTTQPCEVYAPGDYAAHDRYWRANNVTSRRPSRDILDRVNAERGAAARKAIGAISKALLSLHAECEAMRPLVEAACLWRHGLVEVGARMLDSDDGSVEQGMQRPPAVRGLVDAIDAFRARKP